MPEYTVYRYTLEGERDAVTVEALYRQQAISMVARDPETSEVLPDGPRATPSGGSMFDCRHPKAFREGRFCTGCGGMVE